MKSPLHLTAIASLLAMFSLGAAALPTTYSLDFEAEGLLALDSAGPFAVESVQGIKFTGAWAYKPGMFASPDVVPGEFDVGGNYACDPGPCSTTGYLSNRDRSPAGGQKLVLTLDPTVFLGLYITSFGFDIWHNGDPSTSSIRFVDSSSGVAQYQDWTNISAGDKVWSTPKEEAVRLAKATSIEFDFGASALGLDNLRITVDGPGTPPPPSGVPEPGSYALVGLALLAAGAARRRKA